MSSIVVPKVGKPRKLDRAPTPDEQVTEEQAKDTPRVARVLTDLLRDVAAFKRRWAPRVVDFEDFDFDGSGTTVYRFPHGFRARVRFSVVDWTGATGGPQFVRHASTDVHTLCLVSYEAGTATIRVEEAG